PSAASLRALPSFPTRRSSDLHLWERRKPRQACPARLSPLRPPPPPPPATSSAHTGSAHPPRPARRSRRRGSAGGRRARCRRNRRSEEHTSELQSRENLVCRLL